MSIEKNFSNYSELLLMPEWNSKRYEVFQKHNYECLNCNNSKFFKVDEPDKTLRTGRIVDIRKTVTALKYLNSNSSKFYRNLYMIKFHEDEDNIGRDSEILSNIQINDDEIKTFKGCQIYFFDAGAYFIATGTKEERVIFRIVNPKLQKQKRLFYIRNLRLHHMYYIQGNQPWDYPDEAFMTICESCHENLHENNSIPIKNQNGIVIGHLPKGIDAPS